MNDAMNVGNPARNELEQLPRGRHGLPREAVVRQQRERILRAMIDAVAEHGYADTRIADVIASAGVSRKTFYELFEDKEECFLAAYEVLLQLLLRAAREGFDASPDAPWAERLTNGLAAFLQIMADHPAAARVAVIEVMAAGPKALARRDAAMRQFTEFIDAGRSEGGLQLPGITSLALIGGIYELLYTEILHGATAQLPARLPELIYWLTQPYLGAERAAAARDRARELVEAGTQERS